MSIWAKIQYREFYDVPRSLVCKVGLDLLFLDCRFDNTTDEYDAHYTVYKLSGDALSGLEDESWHGLEQQGTLLGTTPVASVLFDESKRNMINTSFKEQITMNENFDSGESACS